MLLDQHERTLAQSEQALAFRSDHINALVDRAGALKRLKRHEDALAAYEHVLAQRPDHLGALNECGGLNVRLGRADAALACYARALAIAPRTTSIISSGSPWSDSATMTRCAPTSVAAR